MAGKKKKGGSIGIKFFVIGIVLISLVFGYYYYLSSKKKAENGEDSAKATAVQEVILRNLERNYPPTPKTVVEFYGQITKCLYNETYTEEELEQMAMQMEKLYDEELVSSKTEYQYIEDLKWDVNSMRGKGYTISNYVTSSSTDVERFYKNGYECAKLYCTFTLRQGTQIGYTNELFLLRKDSNGHWKIYGWTLADDSRG